MDQKLLRLDIQAPDESYETITGILAVKLSFGWEEKSLDSGDTLFRAHCENEELLQEIAKLVASQAPEAECSTDSVVVQDWLTAWKDFFTPVPCGRRFTVLPPWLENDPDHAERIRLVIEPKSAFGTGHHATTALCLTALSDLLDEGRIKEGTTFLDLGTGSGVLGLGLCKSGLTGEGWDIDPVAVDNAIENRGINGFEEKDFPIGLGGVEKVAGRTFDTVVANILAKPLIEMAPELAACRKPDGVLVLSGILDIQGDNVANAYMATGLPAPERRRDGEWVCLIWR